MHRIKLFDNMFLCMIIAYYILFFCLRSDYVLSEQWLAEPGNTLWRAEKLNQGHLLYRDEACQYGPFPVYLYALVARVFGNSARTSYFFQVGANVLVLALACRLANRVSTSLRSKLWSSFILTATMLPYLGLFDYQWAEYIPFENACILLLALSWTPPTERTVAGSLRLGLVLGIWQWIRFGGAAFGVLTIGAMDVIWTLRERHLHERKAPLTAEFWSFLKAYAVTVCAIALLELPLLAFYLMLLSGPLAIDCAFPLYMSPKINLSTYPELLRDVFFFSREPKVFLLKQLLPDLAALFSVAGLGVWFLGTTRLRGSDQTETGGAQPRETGHPLESAIFIPLLFFVFAFRFYIVHKWHGVQFLWAITIGGCWTYCRLPIAFQRGLLALVPLTILVYMRTLLGSPDQNKIWHQFREGHTLYVGKQNVLAYENIHTLADKCDASRLKYASPTFLLPIAAWNGPAFNFAFNPHYALRNSVLIDEGTGTGKPYYFREYDRKELHAELSRICGVVLDTSQYPTDTLATVLEGTVGAELASSLSKLFEQEPLVLGESDGIRYKYFARSQKIVE